MSENRKESTTELRAEVSYNSTILIITINYINMISILSFIIILGG